MRTSTRSCLLCRHPATVTDWAPLADWVAVEDCHCGGFLVWTVLWKLRLPYMFDMERKELSERIRAARARGEAWVRTTDGRVTGALVISGVRPR